MRRLIILMISLISLVPVNAQVVLSKNDLKGINIRTNDFSGTTFYTSKRTGLYVASNKSDVSLQWTLTCTSLDVIIIEDISIKIDGEYYDIPVDVNSRKEYYLRPVSVVFFYSETTNFVDDYLFNVINKMINSKSEVLIRCNVFSLGQESNIDGVVHQKNIEDMRKMVNIYNKLKTSNEH